MIGMGLLLGLINSLLAVLLIVWIRHHVQGVEGMALLMPEYIMERLRGMLHSFSLWWGPSDVSGAKSI